MKRQRLRQIAAESGRLKPLALLGHPAKTDQEIPNALKTQNRKTREERGTQQKHTHARAHTHMLTPMQGRAMPGIIQLIG